LKFKKELRFGLRKTPILPGEKRAFTQKIPNIYDEKVLKPLRFVRKSQAGLDKPKEVLI